MVLYSFRPDYTIYAIGLSSVLDCKGRDKYADALNTIGVFNVAGFTERYKSRLIYPSTAYVFSGENKPRIESDTPDPMTVLGRTKASTEFFIQKSCLNYLVLRCCLFFGRSIFARQYTLMENIERKLFKNEGIKMDGEINNGYLFVGDFAKIVHQCIEKDVHNRLLHLCSSDTASPYDFALKFSKVFGHDEGLIQKGKWEFPIEASVGMDFDVSTGLHFKLESGNIEDALGEKLPSVEESIRNAFIYYGGSDVSDKKSAGGDGISFI